MAVVEEVAEWAYLNLNRPHWPLKRVEMASESSRVNGIMRNDPSDEGKP